jgi:alpha-1,6-mannosyltransferase
MLSLNIMEQSSPKSIVARRTMLFLFALYVCGFAAYNALAPVRSVSARPFLWISSIHALLGLLCLCFLQKNNNKGIDWKSVLLLFLLPRLLVSPMIPWLSDDALRYLWDGNVLLHGFNPYVSAPFSPELSSLRTSQAELFSMLDYTSVTSIYPPLAEYTFAASVWLGKLINSHINSHWQTAYYIWKIMLLVSEGIGLVCVYAALKRLNKPNTLLAAYLLIPLPVIEIAGQAHLDGLLCAPLGGLMYVLARRKKISQRIFTTSIGALCAVLGAIKILPAIILIPILRSLSMKERLVSILFFAGTALFLLLPMLYDTTTIAHFTELARTNALYWQFNGAPYYVLCYAAAALEAHEYWLWMPFLFSYLRSAGILVIAFASNVRNDALFKSILASFCTILLFSPKVHTWYFIPLLLVNTFVGWKWLPVLASGSVLGYTFYTVQPPHEQYGIEMFAWGVALIVGLWEFFIPQRHHSDAT